MTPPSLLDTATREADEAEAEAAALGIGADGQDPFPAPESEPGEQGIATQEEDPDHYEPPEPTEEDLKLADDVYQELQDRAHEMGADRVVDALIQLVDTHRLFITPEGFPEFDDDEQYAVASVVSEVARFLNRGCPKIEAPVNRMVFYWKDHEKWHSRGQTVRAQVKTFDGFFQTHTDGQVAAVLVNYHHWKTLNPRQKVFVVYHALRELDENGKKLNPDFHGFFEEPAIFGAGVFREMVTMARAFVKDAPAHADDPHQLSILEEVYD